VPGNNLLIRIAAAGLPILVIALIAGAAGYVTKGTQTTPIPPLPTEEERAMGIEGSVQSFSNEQLTIVSPDGMQMSFGVPGESTIEHLMTITREDLSIGDWINGGAIPHAQSVLALVGLVLISDPVLHTP
jgi:hypothetical protein